MRYITDYQIRDGDGQTQCYDIEHLQPLVTHIRHYGLFDMQKVSFYIMDDACPGEFRNVIVRNLGDEYVPYFCDDKIQADWVLVREVLQRDNLDDMFLRHVRQPILAVDEDPQNPN
jgi:hypothetical protein